MHEILQDWLRLTPQSFAAICAMMVATYLCRAGGFWLMEHVPLTARVKRGLAALPGSIVMAIVIPLSLRGGLPAAIGITLAFLTMLRVRNEFISLLVGLGAVAAARAAGL